MLNNYQYFIVLAEERNIARAADKLFISHQCLSRYLINLEKYYKVSFFDRKPSLTLTSAGRAYYEMAKSVQLMEENLDSQIKKINSLKQGHIHFGVTDGRYRALMPDLVIQFKQRYPDVNLEIRCCPSSTELIDLVLDNSLDLAFINSGNTHPQLRAIHVSSEELYVVVSENMLRQYFEGSYPDCIARFQSGVDLAEFQDMPFVIGIKGYNSHTAIERFTQSRGIQLRYQIEMSQLDLHLMMTARDYAASFCWSMYLPNVKRINENAGNNRLHVFPIKDHAITNHTSLIARKDKILPDYTMELISLVKQRCDSISAFSFDNI